ncbi:MAG: [Alphaproteobacteria bacterium]|nr:[FeFe] hydrogenase H-cluster radical SAM maturase HydE [Alphaproteobacteria bacterium]
MNLTKAEIIDLLSNKEPHKLYLKADEVRKQNLGDEVHLRALVEFSNICRNNCMYCGLRKDNKHITRYRLTKEEIIETAKNAVDLGFKTIVLQSGEDMYFDEKVMCEIISAIKKYDVALTLSIGERTYKEYKAFKDAGADRYLMRIETTNKDLYHKLDPNMSWDNRHKCLLQIKELGYELGSGIMVGLPNQTIESIADDLLYLRDIEVDMAGIGPFIPHPQTPLSNQSGGTLDLSLRTMAVMRLLLEDINIPATTAMEVLHPNGQILALQSGANVIMPNLTSATCRRLYELYPNKEKSVQPLEVVAQKLHSINRTISKGYGSHKKNKL